MIVDFAVTSNYDAAQLFLIIMLWHHWHHANW
jgi:hypothetical protein